jgi:acetolactate synthase-1/3 small subunit
MITDSTASGAAPRWAILELDVENHPGVMAHIVGLYTRRGCNIEGLVCVPVADGRSSRIWLALSRDARVPQMIKHTANLEDVRAVRHRDEAHDAFARLHALFGCECAAAKRAPIANDAVAD